MGRVAKLAGLTEKQPLLAAITNYRPDKEPAEGMGFVIVTAAAEAGLVDVHDRRPVVLAPEDARLWMDHDFSAEHAEQLARAASLPPDGFEWYKASPDVNNAKNNDEHLIEPI
jgi:putative SOS response-associated peptidase YedK